MKRQRAGTRLRTTALLVHRYVGLTLAVFLLVAGLTGSVLAFQEQLDAALNPTLFRVQPPSAHAPMLDPFELAARVQRLAPHVSVEPEVKFHLEPGRAATYWAALPAGEYREIFVNPYTGALLGSRTWGDLSEGAKNLIPFLYRLHYSLALGDVGMVLLGVVALLWTVDSFVGAYLTLPARSRDPQRKGGPRRWLARWLPAWLLKTHERFALVFTFHRAAGLWLWAMLLVFAWSAVGLNLPSVYRPAMQATLGMTPSVHDGLPTLPQPYPEPSLHMREALALARRTMDAALGRRGERVKREVWLRYAADHGVYVYRVESTLDVSTAHPRTEIYLDGETGALVGFEAPTGGRAGDTLTTWINALHFASVGGLWYRLLVVVPLGIAIAGLSVTGVWIWWRKRRKQRARDPSLRPSPAPWEKGEHHQRVPSLAVQAPTPSSRTLPPSPARGRGPE